MNTNEAFPPSRSLASRSQQGSPPRRSTPGGRLFQRLAIPRGPSLSRRVSSGLGSASSKVVAATSSSHVEKISINKHALLQCHESVQAACVDYNQEILRRAVEDAGRWAYGVMVVEVWCISDDQTKLYRPDGGYWFDPTYHEACHGRGEHCLICRLFDPSQHGYASPKHVAPGEGLPGALWAEVSVGNWTRNHREALARSIMNASTNDKEFRHEINLTHFRTRHIVWRNVKQLHEDPDQPWNHRLKLLAELGLGWAAAVPFSMHGKRGIVIYMARDSVDMERIDSELNETYMRSATDLIGAACAFGEPRTAAVLARRRELLSTLHRVRDKIISIHRNGWTLKEFVERESQSHATIVAQRPAKHLGAISAAGQCMERKVTMVLEKAKGAGVPVPPAFGWKETLFTFLGVMITMSTLTFLHDYIQNDRGDGYAVAIGPNGALMCLLFGLTAAPASQPRNAIIGQAVSMTISLSVASSNDIPLWLRQGLATALSVATMAKLGVTHPPAAASAAIFASGLVNWPSMGFLLFANCIAVILAATINNLSSRRQYPTYWGLEPIKPIVARANMAWRNFRCWRRQDSSTSFRKPAHLHDSSNSNRTRSKPQVAPDESAIRKETKLSVGHRERQDEDGTYPLDP